MGGNSSRHPLVPTAAEDELVWSFENFVPFRLDKTPQSSLCSRPARREVVCTHYKNRCQVVCDEILCRRRYPCVRCHDENEIGHRLDRFEVRRIVCNNCYTEQDVSPACMQKEETEADPCPICLEELSDPNYTSMTLSCGHPIHSECLFKLVQSPVADLCPVCRHPIRD